MSSDLWLATEGTLHPAAAKNALAQKGTPS